MRYLGVDLHMNSLTVCYLQEGQPERFETYALSKLEKFKKGLTAEDKVAVEATGNSNYFYDQIVDKVSEVVIVAPGQFEVIRRSVSKTNKNDSRALAFFLSKGLLPRARIKSKSHREVASLVETREKWVKLRTVLLNKLHGICNGHGIKLKKESLSSKKGLMRVHDYELSELAKIEAKIIIEQVQSLNKSLVKLELTIKEAAKQLDPATFQ